MADDGWHHASDDDQTFVYRDSGDGPLVVLQHGFPDTPHSWDATRERLNGAGYRTVAPWLRGYHPDTVVPDRRYGARQLAEDGVRLLDALDADRATFVGHDWGAAVAFGVAALAPERLEAVVPVGIPHADAIKPSPRLAWAGRHFIVNKFPGASRRAARNDFAYIDKLVSRWAPDWSGPSRDATMDHVRNCFADQANLDHAFEYYRDLSPRRDADLSPPLRVRALVAAGGEADLEAGYRATADLFDPPAELRIFEGTGHWPHREAEAEFLDTLLDFLERTVPR